MNYIINKKVHGCNYWLNFSGEYTVWEGLRDNAHVFSNFATVWSFYSKLKGKSKPPAVILYEDGIPLIIPEETEEISERELQPNYEYNKK